MQSLQTVRSLASPLFASIRRWKRGRSARGQARLNRASCDAISLCEPLESRFMLTTVSMNLNNPIITEGSGSATFTVSRDNSSGSLTVYYRVGGSAPASQFSQTFTGSVVIPSGATSTTIVATPVDDHVADPNRTLTLALTAPEGTSYTLGAVDQATTLVVDADGGTSIYHDLYVGPGQTYSNVATAVAAAGNGYYVDVLSSGAYTNESMTISQSNLTIRGIGTQRAVLNWTSGYIPNEKGIIAQAATGANLDVENMELEGARISSTEGNNASGIRAQGTNLTVTNCYIYNNQDGILNGDGVVTVQYSEFAHNGTNDGQSHNIYMATTCTELVFQYNWAHDLGCVGVTTNLGNLFKSRAGRNLILYNKFDDGTSAASYEVDLPNGGQDTLIGNIIIQQASSANSNIIEFGAEVAPKSTDFLCMANNTVINNKSSGTFVLMENLPANFNFTSENNIFAGPGTDYNMSGSTTSPYLDAGNVKSATVAALDFVDAATGDYHLTSTSPAVNAGVTLGDDPDGYSLTPVYEYVEQTANKTRHADSTPDAGAFDLTEP